MPRYETASLYSAITLLILLALPPQARAAEPEPLVLDCKKGGIEFLRPSSDGRRLITAAYARLYIWDLETRRVLWNDEHKRLLRGIGDPAFSPDGNSVVFVDDGNSADYPHQVIVAQSSTGKRLSLHPTDFRTLFTISPDSSTLAVAGDSLRLWDMASGRLRGEIPRIEDANKLVFSPRGNVLAAEIYLHGAASPPRVILWDARTGRQLKSFRGARTITFSPNSDLLALTYDDRVEVYDSPLGKRINQWKDLNCRSLQFTRHDQHLVICEYDDYEGKKPLLVKMANLETSELEETLQVPLPASDEVKLTSVTMSQNALLVAVGTFKYSDDFREPSYFKEVRVYETATGELQGTFRTPAESKTRCFTFFPDNKRLALGTEDSHVYLWDLPKKFQPAKPPEVKQIPAEPERAEPLAGKPFSFFDEPEDAADEPEEMADEAEVAASEPEEANEQSQPPAEQPNPLHKERTWTSADGNFSVEASLVSATPEIVKLRLSSSGRVIEVPRKKLSQADIQFVKSLGRR